MTLAPARVPCCGRPPSSDISNGRRAYSSASAAANWVRVAPLPVTVTSSQPSLSALFNASTSSPRRCRSECNDERNASLTSKDRYVASEQNRRRSLRCRVVTKIKRTPPMHLLILWHRPPFFSRLLRFRYPRQRRRGLGSLGPPIRWAAVLPSSIIRRRPSRRAVVARTCTGRKASATTPAPNIEMDASWRRGGPLGPRLG